MIDDLWHLIRRFTDPNEHAVRRDGSTFKDKRSNDNRNGDKSSKSQSTPSFNAGQKPQDQRNKGRSGQSSQQTKKTSSYHANEVTSDVNAVSSDKEETQWKFCFWEHQSDRCSFLASLNKTARERLMKAREANYQHPCTTNTWVRRRPSRPAAETALLTHGATRR